VNRLRNFTKTETLIRAAKGLAALYFNMMIKHYDRPGHYKRLFIDLPFKKSEHPKMSAFLLILMNLLWCRKEQI